LGEPITSTYTPTKTTITPLQPPPLHWSNTLSWFPISPALAAAGAPRAASTGHAHRLPPPRIITTAVKSLPPLCTSESSQRRRDPPQRANARTSRVICVTAAPTPSYVGRRSSYTLLRRCTAGVNRAALTSHARHTTQRGQCWVTRTSTSTGGRWRADARRAASPSGFRDAPRTSAAAAGDGDGGWTELLEEPLRKVLEELLSSVHLRTEGVGARPRRRCGWCALGGCLAMTRW